MVYYGLHFFLNSIDVDLQNPQFLLLKKILSIYFVNGSQVKIYTSEEFF